MPLKKLKKFKIIFCWFTFKKKFSAKLDTLPLTIIEGYRYRKGEKKKKRSIEDRIAEQENEIEEPVRRRSNKRLKGVYLVNITKFWSEVREEDLAQELDLENLDNPDGKTHMILQHRIRK